MSQQVKEWFDGLEKVLQEEAEFSGLLGHSSTIGSAREFFIKRVLRSFLPENVHVGSGRIISSKGDGKISNQIDVVVFDGRVQFFRSAEGSALYPVEGVIAAIEVKSTLNKTTLFEALDNCFSVMDLSVNYVDLDEMLKRGVINTGLSQERVGQIYQWSMAPRTYIFSYKGYKADHELLAKNIDEWRRGNGNTGNFDAPCLPRLILTEGLVGAAKDEYISFGDERINFRITQTSKKLGLLASHMLGVINNRFPVINSFTGGQYALQGYNPGELYSKDYEGMPGSNIRYTFPT